MIYDGAQDLEYDISTIPGAKPVDVLAPSSNHHIGLVVTHPSGTYIVPSVGEDIRIRVNDEDINLTEPYKLSDS